MNETIERVPHTEQEAAASYSRLSRWYDRLAGSEALHIAAGLRLLNVQPGERVLEVGFGTGRSLIALAHAVGSTGQVIGVDLAEGMIAVAREQIRKDAMQTACPSAANRVGHPGDPTRDHADKSTGFPPRPARLRRNSADKATTRGNDVVTLLRGSALHLPYATASFNAVFSSFMLDLIDTPDIPIVLGEMRRVLKSGGRAGLASMSKACAGNVVVKVYERCHRWLPKLIDCRPIFLQSAVVSAGLCCEIHQTRSMWAIPVEIVVARK
jgi:ubiquinone/menaquinone biosynthesis C-methylase UbiE